MTTPEQNNFLTQTVPGTPMGTLMRRYWIPALLSSEIAEPDCPPVRVKLLGERLIDFLSRSRNDDEESPEQGRYRQLEDHRDGVAVNNGGTFARPVLPSAVPASNHFHGVVLRTDRAGVE